MLGLHNGGTGKTSSVAIWQAVIDMLGFQKEQMRAVRRRRAAGHLRWGLGELTHLMHSGGPP
jgi:hypothetical protein